MVVEVHSLLDAAGSGFPTIPPEWTWPAAITFVAALIPFVLPHLSKIAEAFSARRIQRLEQKTKEEARLQAEANLRRQQEAPLVPETVEAFIYRRERLRLEAELREARWAYEEGETRWRATLEENVALRAKIAELEARVRGGPDYLERHDTDPYRKTRLTIPQPPQRRR
jgi:hypothetical protein